MCIDVIVHCFQCNFGEVKEAEKLFVPPRVFACVLISKHYCAVLAAPKREMVAGKIGLVPGPTES